MLLAGRRPGVDPLAAHFGTPDKALIPIEGEPMLSRVARTLLGSTNVARVIVLAQDAALLTGSPGTAWLAQEPRVGFADSGQSISAGLADLLRRHPNDYPFLITTADNPLLSEPILDAFVKGAAGADIAVGLVEREALLAAYPGSRRTWIPFRGGRYSGANLFWMASPAVLPLLDVWRRIEQDRKRRWRVIGAFGPIMLMAVLLRLLSAPQAFDRIGQRYGVKARPVPLPFPEACIDVDKLEDFELASAILRQQGRAA